jgi:hypothetical protein
MPDLPPPEANAALSSADAAAAGVFSLDWPRGRLGLVQGAIQSALMAVGIFYLAHANFRWPVRPGGLWPLLFDVAAPMALTAGGIALVVHMLDNIHALAFADRPYLMVSQHGISVSNIARPIAWADVERVFVQRGSESIFPVIWLTQDSRYYRRFWPFWRATALSVHTSEPDETVAMICAHPGYRGEPDDA